MARWALLAAESVDGTENCRSLCMRPRSQTAFGMGNRDASLFLAAAFDKLLAGAHEPDGLGGSAGSAGQPREGSAAAPGCYTKWSNIDVPDHTTSRCSTGCHRGRRGIDGSQVVARVWPLWAWTSRSEIGILNLLGEQSPGPSAGDGDVVVTPFLSPSPACYFPPFAQLLKQAGLARVRARR